MLMLHAEEPLVGRRVEAAHFLVAAGAEPRIPGIPGLADSGYVTSTTAMELDRLPASMVICERCVDDASDLTARRPVETAFRPLKLTTEDSAACSFCGKGSRQVAHIVAGPHALICDECVALCREVQEEEGYDRQRP